MYTDLLWMGPFRLCFLVKSWTVQSCMVGSLWALCLSTLCLFLSLCRMEWILFVLDLPWLQGSVQKWMGINMCEKKLEASKNKELQYKVFNYSCGFSHLHTTWKRSLTQGFCGPCWTDLTNNLPCSHFICISSVKGDIRGVNRAELCLDEDVLILPPASQGPGGPVTCKWFPPPEPERPDDL